MPKVSVVLPIYNTSQYLREALDSVVRQTLKDIEIICINDGSTDDSLEIVKEYAAKDSRIVVIDKPNGGYGHSMNVGIDASTGEYFGILETDDFLALTMFEDLYALAIENDLDTVRADFYRFTREDNGNMNLNYIKINREFDICGEVFNPSQDADYIRKTQINTWAGIYRLSFLREYNIRHNETPGASFQDNGFFWQTQIYAKRSMLVNTPYYYCRRDNPNSSIRDVTKIWAMSQEYDFIRDILMRDKNVWHKFKDFYWLYKFWNYGFTEKLISQEFKREFITYISKEYKRACELGELTCKEFTVSEWSKIQFIAMNPEDYINKNFLNGDALEKAKAEIKQLRNQLENVGNAERWNHYILRMLKTMTRVFKRIFGGKETVDNE